MFEGLQFVLFRSWKCPATHSRKGFSVIIKSNSALALRLGLGVYEFRALERQGFRFRGSSLLQATKAKDPT